MTFGRQDLAHIRGPLIVLLLVAGTGAASLLAADRYLDQLKRDRGSAERQLNDARQRLQQVTSERENIGRFHPRYKDLIARGVVGDERRLDWVESIERYRERRQIFGMRYVISPQKPYTPAPGLATQSFDLRSSVMTVDLNLLHEGQLLDFLGDLQREVSGLYLVDRCRIDRIAASVEMRYAPQLKAECALNWLTLREKK
ncbi:MAG: hypothetical protein HYU77_04670 [Betaproteobacteria bacterium]|nr:hypothetical protein [Betaproteobacteria bacterium]